MSTNTPPETTNPTLLSRIKKALIRAILVTVAVLVLIGTIYGRGYKNAESKYELVVAELTQKLDNRVATYEEVSTESVLSVINSEIKTIGELATIEYLYTNAGKFSDPKELFGFDIPFTTKTFIAKWDGVIKAGVDIKKITAEIDSNKHVIIIHLPKAEILSHEIETSSFETLDEKNGLFNPIKVDDSKKLETESNLAMEARAIENGLLEKAAKNAEELLTNLLEVNPAIKDDYTIVFQTIY